MKPINPRPGVVVAITDKRGELADFDPGAYRRREKMRMERSRANGTAKGDQRRKAGVLQHQRRGGDHERQPGDGAKDDDCLGGPGNDGDGGCEASDPPGHF